MASICPIIAVLSTGLWVQWKINRRHQADYEEENKVEATLV
jgi:hypothetical protein